MMTSLETQGNAQLKLKYYAATPCVAICNCFVFLRLRAVYQSEMMATLVETKTHGIEEMHDLGLNQKRVLPFNPLFFLRPHHGCHIISPTSLTQRMGRTGC